MRGVAFAWVASGALAIGALTSGPASAGCYGDCDDGSYYTSSPTVTYSSSPSYERYQRYSVRPSYHRRHRSHTTYYERPRYRTSYDDRPRYRTTYYERPSYQSSHYEPSVRYTSHYDNGYSYRPYRRQYHRSWYRRHRHHDGYYNSYYPTVRYGGGWLQTAGAYGSPYYGGCHTAYIPYGWTWYRARSC